MDISIKVTYKNEGLQKLRKAAGLSQSQLAALAGIKVQVLQPVSYTHLTSLVDDRVDPLTGEEVLLRVFDFGSVVISV